MSLLEGPRFGPDRPRHPVDGPQLVDDRALDPGNRVRLELDLPDRIEPLDRVDQPDDPVAHQVGLLDVLGQADSNTARDELDQRRVQDDQLIADRPVARSSCTRSKAGLSPFGPEWSRGPLGPGMSGSMDGQ